MDPDVVETGQPYAYAGDDPVNESDQSGLLSLPGIADWAALNAWKTWNDGYRDDCTDFVSRALMEGGGAVADYGPDYPSDHTDPHYWFPSHDLFWLQHVSASYSWADSEHLYEYLLINQSPVVGHVHLGLSGGCAIQDGPYNLPSGIERGDVIFANWHSSNTSGIDHAGIVVGIGEGDLSIAQHSHNKVEPLSEWQYLGQHNGNPGSDTYVWIVRPQQLPTGPLIA